MSGIVFILGAGASHTCGAPLMWNFLDVASDLMRSNAIAVGEKQPAFDRVFRTRHALQAVHSKAQLDLNNIESIFTALELGKVIQRVPGVSPSEIEESIVALKGLIVRTLEITMKFPIDGSRIGPPASYAKFAELLRFLQRDAYPARTVSVITFNYDVGLDVAMCRAGLGPDYGFEAAGVGSVPLLKLHGSLNWATRKVTNQILGMRISDFLTFYEQRRSVDFDGSLPVGRLLAQYFRESLIEVESEPVIVPPSWNKADYHAALSDTWSSAAQHLFEAEHIFVMGYSLPETDSFFRHLYALGSAGGTPLRRFEVFNPDASQALDLRFRNMLGTGAIARYRMHPHSFEIAIDVVRHMFMQGR